MNKNFVFYGSWKDTIDGLEETLGREAANEFTRQIVNFGVTGEIATDDKMTIGIINGMCKDLVEKSQKRYNACLQNGKRGGRPTKYDSEEIRRMYQTGMTHQEIADELGCAVRTVQRAISEEEI